MLFLGTVYQPSLNINLPAPIRPRPLRPLFQLASDRSATHLLLMLTALWNRIRSSYECNEPQWYAPQADAVWNPYWVRFLLDEDGVLWAYGGGMDAPSGAASDMDSEYPAGYVRDWTPGAGKRRSS